MFEDLLYQLVQSYDRVIIPDLGAFLRKDKTDTSEGTPIFSPFLRFNDGLVEDFLVSKKNMTKEEAAVALRDFVGKVKSAVADGGDFFVKKTGAFYADARGAVQFVFAENQKDARKILDGIKAGKPSALSAAVLPAKLKAASDDDSIMVDEVSDSDTTIKQKSGRKTSDKPKKMTAPAAQDTDSEADHAAKPDKIALAAAGLGKWQETIDKRKTQDTAALPVHSGNDEPQTQHPLPHHAPAPPDESDTIREKALEIQRAKMMMLERMKTGAGTDNPDEVSSTMPKLRRRKSGGRILLVLLILAGLSAAVFIWNPANVRAKTTRFYKTIVKKLNSDSKKKTAVTTMVDTIAVTIKPAAKKQPQHTPTISRKQKGMHYLAVARFSVEAYAVEYCAILLRLEYSKAEIIADNQLYIVCIGKSKNMQEIENTMRDHPYKYGEAWAVK
jgi:nucleoid DNA-binding protein